jgi:hypothetical protein
MKKDKNLTDSIKVTHFTWKQLQQIKLDKDYNSIDEVIRDLLGVDDD